MGLVSVIIRILSREAGQVILKYGILLKIYLIFIKENSVRFQKFIPTKQIVNRCV